MAVATANQAAHALLLESLSEQVREMNRRAKRCRQAYKADGPLRDAAWQLAATYSRASTMFGRELARVIAKAGP